MNYAHDRNFFAGRKPRVMAHRGASGDAPENTIPAFFLAIEQEADILETDAHVSLDGHVVVFHDETVDRTTNGTGAVANMTLAELKRLDAGYRFTTDGGKTFPYRDRGVRIATLEEVLATFPQMPINIELKAHDERLVRGACELLDKFGRFEDGSVLLAAFDHGLMSMLRKHAPEKAYTSFSAAEIRGMLLRTWLLWPFRSRGLAFQVPPKRGVVPILTRRFVRLSHALGYEVHPWTIDDPDEMRRLLDLGVDGLFTNYPARARAVINERQK